MAKMKNINCDGCGVNFDKEERYIKAAENKGRGNYCTLSCIGKLNNTRNKDKIDAWNNSSENKSMLKSMSNNRRDEYTDFKILLGSCKRRDKNTDVDLPYLKELWVKQNGKCSITGVDLVLKTSYNKNYQASLDRIDSSVGYVKGNLRYISVSANWLKNNLDDNHLMEFVQICKMIVNS